VLVLSYGRGLTLREIGRHVGLSESGVCRTRARALARVRHGCLERAASGLAQVGGTEGRR